MTATTESILSVEEAIERYPDEWIFMEVTAEDEYHAPSHGLLLAHHPKRGVIQRSIMKTIGTRRGDEIYYLFYGERRIKSREEWTAAVDSMTEHGARR
jgi:hypothetical protein